ncbi:MAG TPA: hypothetical protein VKG26_13865 [Bacteroidia bacterium]|nr:hypothetical protein [Bacteroidia bacterium]
MIRLLFIFFIVSVNIKAQGVICLLPTDTTCNRQYDKESKTYYCTNPDKQPEFKGGSAELVKYMSSNLQLLIDSTCRYGTLKIYIEIQSDGTARFFKLLNPKDCPALEAEVQRVINAMPKWNPGMCKQKVVACRMVLPICAKPQ